MLRPQDSNTRERKNLNGLWHFRLDPEGEGRSPAGSRALPGRPGHGGTGQLQRHRRRRGGARLLR